MRSATASGHPMGDDYKQSCPGLDGVKHHSRLSRLRWTCCEPCMVRWPSRSLLSPRLCPAGCGIATFTSDLMAATRAADPSLISRVAAIDESNVVRLYGHEVRWRIRQGDAAS